MARWLAVLAGGAAWGCSIAGIEALRQPPADLPPLGTARFLLAMMMIWSLDGACWAVAARLAGRRLSPLRMVVVWAAGSVVLSLALAVANVTRSAATIGIGMQAVFGRQDPFDAMFAHTLWLNAVFGGLYVAGYTAFLRALRSRRRLWQLQLALSDESALLQEARLASLRGALQPEVLIEAVRALRARYETDPVAADALLDHLVVYLRLAIGASGPSPATAKDALLALRQAMGAPPLARANS